jgi:iron complex transport system substrate-binding protein
MLELDPDLIIAKAGDMAWYGVDALETFQSIAPVVLSDTTSTTWEEAFLLRGAVIDKEVEAQALLDTYQQRLDEFQEAMGDDAPTIAIIRSRADAFNIYVGDFFIVDVVQSAGLPFPESFSELESPNSISLEEIDILTSDYLFVMVRNEDEGAYFQQASEGPLWAFIPAVQQEQVYQVDWSTWVSGWNIVGAHLVVDDLFGYFTETTSATPNPFADLVTEAYAPVNSEEADTQATEEPTQEPTEEAEG